MIYAGREYPPSEYQYNMMIDWILEHTEDLVDYGRALKRCGFSKSEIADELLGFCVDPDEEAAIKRWLREEFE